MEITKGRYKIKSDKYNYWIEEEQIIKTGQNKGKTNLVRVTGYQQTLPKLYYDFIQTQVMDSDAKSVKEAIKEINDALEVVKGFV